MISFQPTDEQDVAREAMREFATKSLRPRARECDEAELLPDGFLQEAWELGLIQAFLQCPAVVVDRWLDKPGWQKAAASAEPTNEASTLAAPIKES